MNPTIELLHQHRSIRKYTQEKISADLLKTILRAGQRAATSSHLQAYTVIHVTDMEKRNVLVELTGGQKYIAESSDFLVFCADMKRPADAARRAGADVVSGTTEQLLVASIDVALMAQSVVVAAESEGLGICFIGGIRNFPAEVSELLDLPDQVYPVFGLCLGYPDQDTEIKPRLPLEVILKENTYTSSNDEAHLGGFDEIMEEYYLTRTGGNKKSNWSKQLNNLFTTRLRLHMKEFLHKRGLGDK